MHLDSLGTPRDHSRHDQAWIPWYRIVGAESPSLTSGFRHLTSGFRHLTSGFRHPTSGFRHPTSGFRHLTEYLQVWIIPLSGILDRSYCRESKEIFEGLYQVLLMRQMEKSRHDCKNTLSYTIKWRSFLSSFLSMRKTPIIVTIVLVSLASVYALVTNLLPDTAIFPRIPMGNGTIGWTIANILWVAGLGNYASDGTTKNATMLSGITSTGYLRSSGACGATKVWTSLGAGTPTCADKNAILASMGTVNTLSGTVTAYHADGTFETLTSGTGILAGDIIKTNPGTTVTIAFADYSILRVWDDSTVSLDVGTQSGTNLAYAILENGSLWWRVLSETGGYYIGRDDLIVGVRGTSVSFTQSNPTVGIVNTAGHWKISKTQSGGVGQLSIIQSSTDGNVGTVICKDGQWSHEFPIWTGSTLLFSSSITSCRPELITSSLSIASLYADANIAKNVIADIDYMSGILSSPQITPTQRAKIDTEFSRSRPTTTLERTAICPSDASDPKIFWDSLLRTHIEPCQRTNVLAVADFRGINPDSNRKILYLSSNDLLSPTAASDYLSTIHWMQFTPAFGSRFTQYDLTTAQLASIHQSKITVLTYAIWLSWTYAIDLGDDCTIKSNWNTWLHGSGDDSTCLVTPLAPAWSGFTIDIRAMTIDRFIIWNLHNNNKALWTRIEKIIITSP